jgi:thioredoxin-dependent peroxiredoxin
MMTLQLKVWQSALFFLGICASLPAAFAADEFPKVGDTAADFELASVTGDKVKLSKVAESGPVVLIVLRGYPGYQCPACNQQVGQFVAQAAKFRAAGAKVLLVYPGPSQKLGQRAEEFLAGKTLPEGFQMLLDPDYTFTRAYHLRWNAPKETAYPSTFVIQPDRKITFARISETHGGRTKVDEVLKALPAKP